MVTYFKYDKIEKIFFPRLKTEFLAACKAAGINGGRKLSTWEVLQSEAEKGNTKAVELLKDWRRLE